MERNFEFKIVLKGINPAIYRTFVVKEDITFFEFHHVIQIVMGWYNEHLYQFANQNIIIADPEMIDDVDIIDINDFLLNEYFENQGDKINYEYDFGDGWMHEIVLKKITEGKENDVVPICLSGKRNCPPENCGGIYGYMNLIEIMADENHPDYEEMVDWFGEHFDPEYFDIEEVNDYLEDFMNDFPDSIIDVYLN
jgi:hypothetical protein